jgi:hypothetical protein
VAINTLLRGKQRSEVGGFKERLFPWREQPRREGLRGEILSVEKPLRGGMIFKERKFLWRDSSRRDSLRGPISDPLHAAQG